MKTVLLWAFGFLSYFYTALVLQMLWNWFAVPALHLGPIGYWQMYGLHMLILLLLQKDVFQNEDRWKRSAIMLYASVRPENKTQVDEELKEMNDDVYMNAGWTIGLTLIGNTISLGVGWLVYTFLS